MIGQKKRICRELNWMMNWMLKCKLIESLFCSVSLLMYNQHFLHTIHRFLFIENFCYTKTMEWQIIDKQKKQQLAGNTHALHWKWFFFAAQHTSGVQFFKWLWKMTYNRYLNSQHFTYHTSVRYTCCIDTCK